MSSFVGLEKWKFYEFSLCVGQCIHTQREMKPCTITLKLEANATPTDAAAENARFRLDSPETCASGQQLASTVAAQDLVEQMQLLYFFN